MKFLPKELCEKLTKMGCKSESLFHWCIYPKPIRKHKTLPSNCDDIPAFILDDFAGKTKQAKENGNRIWGRFAREHRNVIIEEDWIKYLELSLYICSHIKKLRKKIKIENK